MRNIIGSMQKIVGLMSTAIALPIVYQHLSNNTLTETTNTTATVDSEKSSIFRLRINVNSESPPFIDFVIDKLLNTSSRTETNVPSSS